MLTEGTARLATASRSAIRTYKGIGVSPGIAIGRAVIIERREAAIYRVPIRDDEVPSEVNRFLEAVEKTKTQLQELKQRVKRSMGD
jgi:phosphotransferase system enzyme I (PtsI)